MTATKTAADLRRAADRTHLQTLAGQSGGRLRILELPDRAGRPIRLEIDCRTAASNRYPDEAGASVRLRIDLPARYPFERPVITIETPIFHPNVFSNGVICQGDKWLPGDALDIVVQRIIRLVTFEPGHVNPASAANRIAASWYLARRRDTPSAFPTDRIAFEPQRVLRRCPSCDAGLRLPPGRRGTVSCPRCQADFQTTT